MTDTPPDPDDILAADEAANAEDLERIEATDNSARPEDGPQPDETGEYLVDPDDVDDDDIRDITPEV